ncbi:MAG: DedA family protein [Ignavibacteria bacterium]|nr:DedA family protein [Ignavibacteria bacterium]
MLEEAIRFLSSPSIPVFAILFFAFLVTFIENIFPPSPSDTILIFIGSLAGIGKVDFIPLLIFSTIGSSAGFILLFWFGMVFGNRIVESNKFPFINQKKLKKPRQWFRKWGYLIIVVNRFLSGTRAVISFFAGISKLSIPLTVTYAVIGSLIWNALLLYLGFKMGKNWHIADQYIDLYGQILLPTIIFIVLVYFLVKYLRNRKKSKSKANRKKVKINKNSKAKTAKQV